MNTAYFVPLRLVLPFFVLGLLALLLSILILFTIDINNFNYLDFSFAALVHLYLLGFVMMIIIGSLAQLLPVVLEKEHYKIELYYLVFIGLVSGVLLMFYGFHNSIIILAFGGSLSILAFFIFLFEASMSILKGFKLSFTSISLLIANIALFIALICAFLMILNLLSIKGLDFIFLFRNHLAFIFIFLYFTIMSISLVLIPMFFISHNFSKSYANFALTFALMALGLFNFTNIYKIFIFISLLFYFYQLFVIFKKRARKVFDAYLKGSIFAFFSLLIALILGFFYIKTSSLSLFLLMIFYIAFGFLLPLITTNLYKIIPFLIWSKLYAPLVGKQKLPSLSDLVPKSSNYNLPFNILALILASLGIAIKNIFLYNFAVFLLLIAVLILIKNIFFIISLKQDHVFKEL